MEADGADGAPDLADLDYGDDAHLPRKDAIEALAELDRLMLALERAQAEQLRLDAAAAKAKQLVDKLATRDIPDLLDKLHLKEGVTKSGVEFKMRREIRAVMLGREHVERRARFFDWLVAHGHGGVIKNVVRVDLDRGEDDRADALVIELRAKGFAVDAGKDVHPSTLSALMREIYEAGKAVPPNDLVNRFDDRKVKISRK